MVDQVTGSLPSALVADGLKPGRWWHRDGDRVVCDLCPRACALHAGDRGFCFVRQNLDGQMVLTTYGKSTGFCVDPIEKKPLNHFYPGTSVLSFGTAGCNLGCKFCQNWDISKSREIERLSARAMPEHIAHAAKELGCLSVAFTYNDPVIWAEYAIDTARACHDAGVRTVAVTAGYITREARGEFYEVMDAANVDLKAFTEEFYRKITLSHLEPVLETLRWLKHETDVWFEITNLVIPETNDDTDEFRRMCDWILANVGDEVPLHFTAFHPDFRMLDKPHTPPETLVAAREIALETGLKYVYVGNVHDVVRQSTYCPGCGKLLIERDWHALGKYALAGKLCAYCGYEIAGHFADRPGTWGRRRLPVDMRRFLPPAPAPAPAFVPLQLSSPPNSARSDSSFAAARTAAAAPRRSSAMSSAASTSPAVDLSTDEHKDALLAAAGEILKAATLGQKPVLSDPSIGGLADQPVWGVFVTVKRGRHLRSCCGSFGRSAPLRETLTESAVRTATNDPRFPPLSPSELPHLHLDVWLLHKPEEIAEQGADRIHAVTVGVHGLQIIRGNNRGLLLPGVPVEAGWDSEEFLNRVAMKANLPPTAWRDSASRLIRFRGDCVEGLLGEVLGLRGPTLPRPLYDADQLAAYSAFCRQMITAFVASRTPNLYLPSVPDADVSGVALGLSISGTSLNQTLWRLAIRGKNPLQSTLASMCQEVAQTWQQRGLKPEQCERLQVVVTVFADPAMHGTVGEPDLAGVSTSHRGLMVRERSRTAWLFDRHRTPEELLAETARLAEITEPHQAAVYSFAVVSTRNPVSGGAVPRPVAGQEVRKPAVAGQFYPGRPADVSRMVTELLGERVATEKWAAALVPHAGWKFSGRLAAEVLKRIDYPANIIIIGPKHTPPGVEWAVAPHLVWGLPNGNLGSNERIARQLAASIPGLQLDAAAHQEEHGIEVELPFIARLSPASRVVGIVIGAASKDRCDQFAEGLAGFLRQESEPPLLIISSDMSHYATDAESRRLDAMALEKLQRLDAEGLYDVCTEQHISMCGMRPAVMVLKTLQKLGRLNTCERVGYCTSADVTGDTSRVVGYAGLLFR